MTGMKIERVYYDELGGYYSKQRTCPMCGMMIPDADEYQHPDSNCKLSGYTAIRRGVVTRWKKDTERQLLTENAMLKEALRAVDIDCAFCRHNGLIRPGCLETDVGCEKCTDQHCACRSCRENSNWEWGPQT